jgi:2-dehydro-3-deoxyphosphooctonate aldolase (KDO 8-P synthase)
MNITIPKIHHSDSNNFFLIAGPCVVEGRDLCFEVAEKIITITDKYKIPFVFKGSYRKANRTKVDSFTGIGDEKALRILEEIGKTFNIPTITDIHESHEAAMELLVAAAQTGKVVSVKKGQFLSGQSMQFAVEKIKAAGNPNVMLTDRGNSFGYSDLVVDYRNIVEMKAFDVPVVMDCTHSLQQPNQTSGVTGGKPAMIETIAKAAIAVGADGLFIETHPNPSKALSDGANMLALDKLDEVLGRLVRIRQAIL